MSTTQKRQRSAISLWFANLPLKAKGGLVFGILTGLYLLLLGGNAIATMAADAQQRHAEQMLESLLLSTDTARVVRRRQTDIFSTALLDPPGLPARVAASNTRVTEALARLLESTGSDTTMRPAIERAIRVDREWRETVAAPFLAATERGGADIAAALRLLARAEAGAQGTAAIVSAIDDAAAAGEAALSSLRSGLVRYNTITLIVDVIAVIATLIAALIGAFLSDRFVITPLRRLAGLMERLAAHDHSFEVPHGRREDEVGKIARGLIVFKTADIATQENAWVKAAVGDISARMQGCTELRSFADTLLVELAPRIEAGVGVFYRFDPASDVLELTGSYAFTTRKHVSTAYRLGEGLVGQAALERKPIALSPVPEDYLRIHSGTGEASPRTVVALPVTSRDRLLGVLELATFAPPSGRNERLLAELMPLVSLSLDNLLRALDTRNLLDQSQRQATELRTKEEELRTQQEELRATNEQLYAQSQKLAASEEELRVQAEELRESNDVLRRSGDELAAQKELLEALNRQMEARAEELVRANQYKSQFLANMSHELRTPLNSLLILSHDLAENRSGNLDPDQVEAAGIIHTSGSNLLRLINDILDLSKVEAGKMEVSREAVNLTAFSQRIERNFRRLAQERKLRFVVTAADAPEFVYTDMGKLEQILNNLVGNALKFTMQGRVSVVFARGEAPDTFNVVVADSGIGIPEDKMEAIFGAFEQVDASTRRQFGGTGLGLAITRRLAELLGGTVTVESRIGQGSTFTLVLPVGTVPDDAEAADDVPAVPAPAEPGRGPTGLAPLSLPAGEAVADDRETLDPQGTIILVVEDDPVFARTLAGIVRRKGHQVLVAGDGESGIDLARRHRPTGILLDVMLPGMDGWTVIERLKADSATRHIPVHFVSALDETRRGRDLGAVGFLTKPVTAEKLGEALQLLTHFSSDRPRRVLVVDDDDAARHAVRTLLGREKAEIVEAASGEEALDVLGDGAFDCIVLDLGLPGMSGFEFIERLAGAEHHIPVVVYSGRDLTQEESLRLRAFTDSIVVKGALSPERLLDEVNLFLHSVRNEPRGVPEKPDGDLEGIKLLLVDDDMRNIYALAKVLRARGINVVLAQDGAKALAQLDEQPDVEIVLMDVMMPVMDGYEAMAQIRAQPRFAGLPVIALTAKAMKDDREKCLAAGASDYLAKPVDVPKLLSMIRAWVPKR